MKRILLDYDNVLSDTERLRKHLSDSVIRAAGGRITHEDFLFGYDKGMQNGILDVSAVAEYLAGTSSLTPDVIENIFYDAPFRTFLFPGSLELLRQTKNDAIIYSAGDEGYQPVKIRKSGVVDIIGEQNLIITRNKYTLLPEIFQRLRQEGTQDITIIDDRSNILDVALAEGEHAGIHVIAVWMRYGKYTDPPKRREVTVVHTLNEFAKRCIGIPIEGYIRNRGQLR